MKESWQQYLCDPVDGSPLTLKEVAQREGERILEGMLAGPSGRVYPVTRGIPVFLPGGAQSQASVESFAYEWNEFGFLYARAGWVKDIVEPFVGGLDFFRGKTVVDAGAGSGAQSRWMAEAGAALVISLELSSAVFDRHRATIEPVRERVFAIQCDIAHPPLRVQPDVLYCVNVIQHTADPRATFARLARLVGAHTTFLFNIYTKRSEFKFRIVRAVRRLIRLLPFSAWKWLAFLIAAVAHPLAQIRVLNRPIRIFVPISHSFRETWFDVYDAFGAHHYQENMSRPDQEAMIAEEGLAIRREARFGYVLERAAAE